MEPLAAYVDRRIRQRFLQRPERYRVVLGGQSPEELVSDLSGTVFSKEIQCFFTNGFVRSHACAGRCGRQATERCHGAGEERPVLLLRALRRLWPAAGGPAALGLREVLVAFMEEHKTSAGFCFKCARCHAAESRAPPPLPPRG